MSEEWQDTLRAAITREYGSIKGYARHRAGKGASENEVARKRRQIGKWLQEVKPSKPKGDTIRELVRDLKIDPEVFPATPAKVTLAALADLHQQTLANQKSALALLESLAIGMEQLAASVEDGMALLDALRVDVDALRSRRGSVGNTQKGTQRAG